MLTPYINGSIHLELKTGEPKSTKKCKTHITDLYVVKDP